MDQTSSERPANAQDANVVAHSPGWTANWSARLYRSERGTPQIPAEFAAGQGASVRLIDSRDPQDFVGPLGYIPGSDWIPLERIESLPERIGLDAPVILISRHGERAGDVARTLEALGMRYVAALGGGISQWISLGFSITRDPSILDRCDVLRPIAPPPMIDKDSVTGLTIEQVEEHLGDPTSVRWIKLAALVLHAPMSCIDGRDDRCVVGTPGGDAGQFLLGLAATESVLGRALEPETISTLLERRIDALGGFYKHTDSTALAAVTESILADPELRDAVQQYGTDPNEWRQFIRRPPLILREAVLEHLCAPAAIGCGHIRLMLQRSDEYRVRPSLVTDFLRAFFHARWDGAFRADYESLHGQHDERAVLITRVEGKLLPFSSIPLISPSYFDSQMFVYHPQASSYLSELLADFLLLQTDLIPEFRNDIRSALMEEMENLANIHRERSLFYLAKGLPIYNVIFTDEAKVRVEPAGVVS